MGDDPTSFVDDLSLEDLSNDPLIGQVVGDYQISKRIGLGGMGAVYLARDQVLDRDVALKFLSSSLVADREAIDRFLEEARNAAQLDHPHVVGILSVGVEDGRPYLVMPYLSAGSLADLLSQKGPLETQEAVAILRDVARGLEAIHSSNMIHHDVKPENILMDQNGLVKISDFGLSTVRSQADLILTQEGQLLGTPYTISPEQCQGHPLDHRSDVYSLGVTFYRMLTNHWPFDGETSASIIFQQLQTDLPDPRQFVSDLHEDVVTILNRMTAKKVEDRYASMKDLVADLDRFSHGERLHDHSTESILKAPSERLSFWVFLVLLSGLIFLVTWPTDSKKNKFSVEKNLVVPPAKPLEEPQKTILAYYEKAKEHNIFLESPDFNNRDDWYEVLLELNHFENILLVLSAISQDRQVLADLFQDFEDARLEWVPRISQAIVDPLIQNSRFESILDTLQSLPESLAHLPRVSQYYFDVIEQHIDILLESQDPQVIDKVSFWVDQAWFLNVSQLRKSSLITTQQKVTQLAQKLGVENPQSRERLIKRWQLAQDYFDASKINDGLMILESCLIQVRHPSLQKTWSINAFISTMTAQKKFWQGYRDFQLAFDQALDQKDFDQANQIWQQWNQNYSFFEVDQAWRQLEIAQNLNKAKKFLEEDSVSARVQAIKSCGRIFRLEPFHLEANQIAEQVLGFLEPNLRRKKAAQYFLEGCRFHGQGDFSEALASFESLSFGSGDFEGLEMIRTINQEQDMLTLWNKSLETFASQQWSQTLDLLQPWLKKPQAPSRFRWLASRAYLEESNQAQQSKDWSTAWVSADLACQTFPEGWEQENIKKDILASWSQVVLESLAQVEVTVEESLERGDPQSAVKKLKQSLATGVDKNLYLDIEVQKMLENLRKRYSDLVDFLHWLSLAQEQYQNRNWEDALLKLSEAEKIREIPFLTGDLRRRLSYQIALSRLDKTKDFKSRLRFSWEAWANREENQVGENERHLSLRFELARTVAVSADLAQEKANSQLEGDRFQEAIALVKMHLSDLRYFEEDLKREPALTYPDRFQKALVWWGEFSQKLEAKNLDYLKALESKKKFSQYLQQAQDFESQSEFKEALDALKNARLHSNHLTPQELKSLDNRLDRLETKRQIELKRESIQKALSRVTEAEEAEDWSLALEELNTFSNRFAAEDLKYFFQDDSVLIWQLRFESRIQDQKDFERVLKQCQSLNDIEALAELRQFIRLNAGNYYVTTAKVQKEIDLRNKRLEETKEKIRSEVKNRIDFHITSSDFVAARKVVLEALETLSADQNLLDMLAVILDQDQVFFSGGEFLAGSEEGEGVQEDEGPPWLRKVDSFLMNRFEVTNIQYARFVREKNVKPPDYWIEGKIPFGKELFPVHRITWEEAKTYATWVGARLPTEFEWEWAARGGEQMRRWPWGNDEDLTRANAASRLGRFQSVFENAQGASADGLLNLSGNVAEWTQSPYVSYPKKDFWGRLRPSKPLVAGALVVRGGSMFDFLTSCRTTSRRGLDPENRYNGVGFRLCWSSQP